MIRDFYSYKNFCGSVPLKFIELNKEVLDMFDDARLEKLENLYDKYDSATTKSEKRRVLNEILEIKPEYVTIDSEFDISELPGQPEDTYNTISSLNELIKKRLEKFGSLKYLLYLCNRKQKDTAI